MNILKIDIRAGEHKRVVVKNYSQVQLTWTILSGTVQVTPVSDGGPAFLANIFDSSPGESVIAVHGGNRCAIIQVNCFDASNGDLVIAED